MATTTKFIEGCKTAGPFEESLEALIYKLAEAVGVDLDNIEEK